MARRNKLPEGRVLDGREVLYMREGVEMLHSVISALVSRYREIEHVMDHTWVDLGMPAMRKTLYCAKYIHVTM